jgi:hypothetical protein
MGTHYINLRRKNGQKEDWLAADLTGRHYLKSSRKTVVENSLKPEQME